MIKLLFAIAMMTVTGNNVFAKAIHCVVITSNDPWSTTERFSWGPDIQWTATLDLRKGTATLSSDVEFEGEDNPFAVLPYRAQIANQFVFQGVNRYHKDYSYKLTFNGSTGAILEIKEGRLQKTEKKELECRK